MDYYLLTMLVVAVGLLLVEALSLCWLKNKITVPGTMPSQKVTFPILGIIFIYIFVENFGTAPISLAVAFLYIVVFVLAMMLKNGMTDKGVAVQGIVSRYEKIRYYIIDTKTAKNPRIRIGLGFQEKFVEMSEADAQKARKLFTEKGVATFEEYKKVRNAADKNKK